MSTSELLVSNSTSNEPLPRELRPWEACLLKEGTDDYLGLWEVVTIAREHEPHIQRKDILGSLEFLLLKELIEAGWPGDGEFLRRGGTAEFIIQWIAREWQKLGHDPQMGEVIWFNNTAKGDSVAAGLVCRYPDDPEEEQD